MKEATMYARKIGKVERTPKKSTSPPSDQLRIGVTFPRPDGGPGPTKFDAPLSTATVQRFVPDPLEMDRALYSLAKLGFKVTQRGRLTASMRGSRGLFEKVFGTKLSPIALDTSENYAFHSFYYPPQGAPWSPSPEVAILIDDAYIQWPHIYMRSAGARRHQASAPQPAPAVTVVPSGTPPTVNFFHLLASDYASAFDSKIYSGRHVPDFCGLVGMLPHANYIMLPIPPGCQIDTEV